MISSYHRESEEQRKRIQANVREAMRRSEEQDAKDAAKWKADHPEDYTPEAIAKRESERIARIERDRARRAGFSVYPRWGNPGQVADAIRRRPWIVSDARDCSCRVSYVHSSDDSWSCLSEAR